VLEEFGVCRRRGAHIMAEIMGYGMSETLPHHAAAENATAPYRVMLNTLRDAKCCPSRSSTQCPWHLDRYWGQARNCRIKRAFGEHALQLAVKFDQVDDRHLLGGPVV